MKTLIAFASKYGAAKDCAEKLKSYLNGDALVLPVKDVTLEHITACDTVLLGGSIYCGQIRKEVKNFAKQYTTMLLQKRLGLFLCCATPPSVEDYIDRFYAPKLLNHATAKMILGGAIQIEKLTFFDRQIMKLVKKSETFQMPIISDDQIRKFADQFETTL